MIELHKGSDRGTSRLAWLESRHSFSFADWHDSSAMGFRSLRVLNEDRVAAGAGFGRHPHRDMEILTVVLEGALEHRDSSGARSVLRAGDTQHMSAGSGVIHSESNASDKEALRFLQIWLHPATSGTVPRHAESRGLFPVDGRSPTGLRPLATNVGGDGALDINVDAKVFAGRVDANIPVEHPLASERGAWVQAVRGELIVNGIRMVSGDGLSIENEQSVVLSGDPEGDFLLFDLA
ncbi:MAG: redox-sensitive bicupin YhaK (pirin superfamily) [Polyangiales bacterium]|jgi:redox-sensitive bicupin YhaK (pirin superfamily)